MSAAKDVPAGLLVPAPVTAMYSRRAVAAVQVRAARAAATAKRRAWVSWRGVLNRTVGRQLRVGFDAAAGCGVSVVPGHQVSVAGVGELAPVGRAHPSDVVGFGHCGCLLVRGCRQFTGGGAVCDFGKLGCRVAVPGRFWAGCASG